MEITSFHCSYYDPTNHGIVLKIKGKIALHTPITYPIIKMNFHGHFWKYLPLGLDKVVKWTYLPMSLGGDTWKTNTYQDYDDSVKSSLQNFIIEIPIGTKENGRFGISRNTLYQELKKMSNSVKSVLEIEFLYAEQWGNEVKPFFSLFTTPPLIFDSAENQKDARFEGEIPLDIRSQSIFSEAYEYFRWAFLPMLFLIFLIVSCHSPGSFLGWFPKIFFTDKLNVRIEEILPPCPQTSLQIWNVSRLEYEYTQLEMAVNTANLTRMEEILVAVAGMVGRSFVNKTEIHLIYEELVKKELEQGLSMRVTGMFNFINLIWLLAIIGIVISVGPFIYTILKPLRGALWNVAVMIWHHVIIPMHSWGILEMMSYYICMAFVTEGLRYETVSGFYISITGLFLSFAANVYTFFLRGKIKPDVRIHVGYSLLFTVYMIPMAITHQSLLLGWLSVICFYQAVGFSFICYGLCYCVGFHDDEAMVRVSITSTIMGIVFIILKWQGISNEYIHPFSGALTIFSATLLLLALLIFSSYYYRPRFREYHNYYNYGDDYAIRQIPMIVCLSGFLFFGNIFNMVGLVNTATTYLVFYCMEKYCDAHYKFRWNSWVLMFLFSVIIYKSALYLHENPEILFSMFNYNV